LMMPGVHDALNARIAENAGFSAGSAATGALLGRPDSSQLSATEMAIRYARICEAVAISVFIDTNTGYRNITNVHQTIREFERTGVASLFIKDQNIPKHCGHTSVKDLITVENFLGKLKDARRDPDFMVMARTDALGMIGFDEVITRGQMALEIGVVIIFVKVPGMPDEMHCIRTEIDAPPFAKMVDYVGSPLLTAQEFQDIGYATAMWPVASVFTATKAMRATLKRDGTTRRHGRLRRLYDSGALT
jgi:2-methylisocitrate lyase-like PEP mutase family enzyme